MRTWSFAFRRDVGLDDLDRFTGTELGGLTPDIHGEMIAEREVFVNQYLLGTIFDLSEKEREPGHRKPLQILGAFRDQC